MCFLLHASGNGRCDNVHCMLWAFYFVGALAQINIQGPNARDLIQSLTKTDMSNEAFPFRTAKQIDIGFAQPLCTRITYVGELGYELFVPAESAVHLVRH